LATLKDIARITGVSVSTVSRALSGKGRISAEKRKKILSVVEQLKYTPNYHARSMVSGATLTVGLVVPDITNPFFGRLTRGVMEFLGNNALVILMDSFRQMDREDILVKKLRDHGAHGIIIGNSRVNDDLVKEISHYIPTVVFDKAYSLENVSCVLLDNIQGAYVATKHLLEVGCQRVIHLAGTPELSVSLDRKRGYETAMKEAGLQPLVYEVGYDKVSGYAAMKKLLSSGKAVDGVFCMNDLVAIGALKAINEFKLKVPEEICVVGFDDTEICELVNPSLTTVHQPAEEMGKIAAKLLTNMINLGASTSRYVLSPYLVIRSSTARRCIK